MLSSGWADTKHFCAFVTDPHSGNDSEGENSSPTKKATPGKKTKGQKKKNKPVAAASDDDGDEAEDSIVVKSESVEPQAESDE